MANKVTIRNAKIIWRNFRGEASNYNNAGDRNFSILIDDEDLANELIDGGWRLKSLTKRAEDEGPAWALKVRVKFGKRPPKIMLVTYPGGKMKTTPVTEETVSMLDWAEPQKIDLTITPYEWTMGKGSGITAYLDVMYFTPVEDVLSTEYATAEDDDEVPFD